MKSYSVLERQILGFSRFVNGKTAAKAGDQLAALAKQ